jgi:hypothetical protein
LTEGCLEIRRQHYRRPQFCVGHFYPRKTLFLYQDAVWASAHSNQFPARQRPHSRIVARVAVLSSYLDVNIIRHNCSEVCKNESHASGDILILV